jgi:hypothetical protein
VSQVAASGIIKSGKNDMKNKHRGSSRLYTGQRILKGRFTAKGKDKACSGFERIILNQELTETYDMRYKLFTLAHEIHSIR